MQRRKDRAVELKNLLEHPGWKHVRKIIDERMEAKRARLETEVPGPETFKVQGGLAELKQIDESIRSLIRDGQGAASLLDTTEAREKGR